MNGPDDVRVFSAESADGALIEGTHVPDLPVNVEVSTHDRGDVVIDGIPDDAMTEAHAQRSASGSRVASDSAMQQSAQQAAQEAAQAQAAASLAVDASATTDPHHDRGSGATGHVDDAAPDTHGAGPAEEPTTEPEPEHEAEHVEPVHEEPTAPAVEATHDASATTTDSDGS